MPKAIIFFDLDLTLLDDSKTVPAGNRDAIRRLIANDCLPVLCTGKNYWETAQIRADTGITAVVAANGAEVYVDGKAIAQSAFKPAEVAAFIEQANQDGYPVAMYNGETAALTRYDDATAASYALMVQKQPPIVPDFAAHEAVAMMLLFTPQDDPAEPVQRAYAAQFPDFTFYRNGPYALDVVQKSVNKGTGVHLLQDTLGLGDVPTYAFGDGNNDIEMFDAVDVGVAMGNALPALLPHASYQTDDYLSDGITHALEHFNLI